MASISFKEFLEMIDEAKNVYGKELDDPAVAGEKLRLIRSLKGLRKTSDRAGSRSR